MAGQVAYLEKLRTEKLRACGIMIQKHVRGWQARSRYMKIKKSVVLIQCYARGLLARRLAKSKRETRAAVIIQSNWKGTLQRRVFLGTRQRMVKLQVRFKIIVN